MDMMMTAAAMTFVWWLVIANSQGGMVVMPNSFDTKANCEAAIAEYQKDAKQNWVLSCVPTQDESFAD